MLQCAPDSASIRLRELRDQRKSLWKRFENYPSEIHLAAKLRILDDQIAQLNQEWNHEAGKIDDSEVAAAPDVGGLFLLLAVSQRRGS